MGRANRGKSGLSGGGMRGAESTTPKTFGDNSRRPYKPSSVDRCKTENQKTVLETLQRLSDPEGVYVSEGPLRRAAGEMDFDSFVQARNELEGIGASGQTLALPLVDVIRNPQTGEVSGIRPLNDWEYDQRKFASDITPAGYGDTLRRIENRNESALAAARTPEERRIIEAMVGRARMDEGHPENFWTRPELLEGSPRLKQEMDQALQDLTERGVLQDHSTPEGSRFSLTPHSNSRYPGSELGKHDAYREQFGEEKYSERMKHVSAKIDQAYQMAQNEKEQALLFYIQSSNPYLNDDSNFISYSRATRAMSPLMSSSETGDLLQEMTSRGIFSARESKRGGVEYCVSDDLALLRRSVS